MREKAFALPDVVRSVVLETTVRLLPEHRDSETGVIRDKDLTLAVLKDMDQKQRAIARRGRGEAWAVSVYGLVREHIRLKRGTFVPDGQDGPVNGNGRVRVTQRQMVTFTNHAGVRVTKDRPFVRKDELPLVRIYAERMRSGADAIIDWVDAVERQMTLRGLGDDALVREVLNGTEN